MQLSTTTSKAVFLGVWLTVALAPLNVWAASVTGVGIDDYNTAEEVRAFWRRQIDRGMSSFVLRYGVLGWGSRVSSHFPRCACSLTASCTR